MTVGPKRALPKKSQGYTRAMFRVCTAEVGNK